MKVLLTGTIATGKSTLIEMMGERGFANATFIPEIAREVLKKHPEYEKREDFQDILFATQCAHENKATGLVICDRGSVDIVAHARLFGHPVKQEWVDWGKTYDKIFVLDHSDIPFDDSAPRLGLPERNWGEFRQGLSREIERVLHGLGVAINIVGGTPEERLRFFEQELGMRYKGVEGTPTRFWEMK